jgi:UPF0755 protein
MKAFIIAILIVLIGEFAYIAWWPGAHTAQRFVVSRGTSAHAIAKDLKDQRLIGSTMMFRTWAKFLSRKSTIHPGVYMLHPGWSGYRILQQIHHGPPLERITLPEGWTAKQMAESLESHGVTPAAEFLAAVQKGNYEGFLFPDTYLSNQGLPAEQVVTRMVHRFHEEEPKDMLSRAKAMHLSYRQIVILASLVEREARVPAERPVIAGVFYNRLRKHMHIESCATIEYALGAPKPHLTYKDLQIDSPYNTYRHPGLPPGPICNPGKASLEAAAHPLATPMLFFVSKGDGTHSFSTTYQEHLAVQKHKK